MEVLRFIFTVVAVFGQSGASFGQSIDKNDRSVSDKKIEHETTINLSRAHQGWIKQFPSLEYKKTRKSKTNYDYEAQDHLHHRFSKSKNNKKLNRRSPPSSGIKSSSRLPKYGNSDSKFQNQIRHSTFNDIDSFPTASMPRRQRHGLESQVKQLTSASNSESLHRVKDSSDHSLISLSRIKLSSDQHSWLHGLNLEPNDTDSESLTRIKKSNDGFTNKSQSTISSPNKIKDEKLSKDSETQPNNPTEQFSRGPNSNRQTVLLSRTQNSEDSNFILPNAPPQTLSPNNELLFSVGEESVLQHRKGSLSGEPAKGEKEKNITALETFDDSFYEGKLEN